MNYLDVSFSKIQLTVGDPLLWVCAKKLTGKISDIGPGVFEMSLSAQNLQRIAKFFETRPPQPVVRSGREHINRLKSELNRYKEFRAKVSEVQQKVVSGSAMAVAPNDKFVPYSHQTWIVETIKRNPYSPVFADCGLGKTGSLARAIELLIQEKQITPGKILISAPLSILTVSWMDDVKKFTNLRPCVLWTNKANKTILSGESVTLHDYGLKPEGYLTTKSKTGVAYWNSLTGELKSSVTTFDDKSQWTKFQLRWKVAVMPDGEQKPFGPAVGKVAGKEKTRELYVRDMLSKAGSEYDLFITNHDSVRMYAEIFKDFGFEWVAVDESSKIKSPTSQLARAHIDISWKCKRRTVLSGTPNPNGFQDLWQQFYFLDRGLTLEPAIKDFYHSYFRPESVGWRNVPNQGPQEVFKQVIRDDSSRDALVERVRSTGIYLKQRDCIELPPRTDLKRIVYMTDEQEEAYRSMEHRLVAELRNSNVSVEAEAVNVLSQLMKLRQITSGFLTNTVTQEVAKLDNNPKINELEDVIEELGDCKCVISAQFKEEIRTLEEKYPDSVSIHGDVSPQKREEAVRKIQTDPNTKLIILQPQAAAHGITLTAANYLVFQSLDYNFDNYYQVAKRIERLGQKNSIFIIHLLARYQNDTPTIDEDLLEVLHYKNSARDALFTPTTSVADIAGTLMRRLIERTER